MGIPAFYSNIVKKYPTIVKHIEMMKKSQLCAFYIDANSIIYDVVKQTKPTKYDTDLIIQNVIIKLETYIKKLNPIHKVFIAFDGVCPLAKIEQQRARRYKNTNTGIENDISENFNTILITSGTEFMKTLTKTIKTHFLKKEKYESCDIIVSGVEEQGEGEQKIFLDIRKNTNKYSKICVYGLDADLIILSLIGIIKEPEGFEIFLTREKPHFEFTNSLQHSNCKINDENELYYLEIHNLFHFIFLEMVNIKMTLQDTNSQNIFYDIKKQIVKDYIFISFLLGNDFLPPHFSLNIRTHGLKTLCNVYNNILGCNGKTIITQETNTINWSNLYILLTEFQKHETINIQKEYNQRNKTEQHWESLNNPELVPLFMRDDEKYISPIEDHWEHRYYNILFEIDIYEVETHNDELVKKICKNYLMGLEWNWKYYFCECPDWLWYYQYGHYAPLIKDIASCFIECVVMDEEYYTFFPKDKPKNETIITPEKQLLCVLPRQQLKIVLPPDIYNTIENFDLYPESVELLWVWKKYLWEATPKLPHLYLHFIPNTKKNKHEK